MVMGEENLVQGKTDEVIKEIGLDDK